MASSLLNLFNNLDKGIHKIKCKNEHDSEKSVKRLELNTMFVSVVLNIKTLKMTEYCTVVYAAIRITKTSFMKIQTEVYYCIQIF